ncbi:class I SAM-dependent methyltransferase (plasmid) [Paraburkholderia sp. PREW-6R]|uniref:class I SAM-dependent methyltransferase n=1 Tax=Paraburkholderia sp. PREW-6R TaxID=3141544 RepID=UPI0031F4C789
MQKRAMMQRASDAFANKADCLVCGGGMRQGVQHWHYVCARCGYEAGDLQPAINDSSAHNAIDEADREAGLRAIRTENFREVVGLIAANLPVAAKKLLDVGCAHGWFLEQAAGRFDVLGIEPDEAVRAKTAAKGLPVRGGYFPQALLPGETFDAIVFNDVIEHIPDIDSALAACRERLNPGGVLVLNLPNSKGLFYRVSKFFAAMGWTSPFERMWQKGFPSPHVHFFGTRNLAELVDKHQMRLVREVQLPSIRAKGMLERMRYSTHESTLNMYLQYIGAMAILPFTKLFQSDVIVCLFAVNPK